MNIQIDHAYEGVYNGSNYIGDFRRFGLTNRMSDKKMKERVAHILEKNNLYKDRQDENI